MARLLSASASCSIVVLYNPTGITIDNDTIEIGYFDGAATQTSTRDVTGQGIPPGILTFSDAPLYDFGTVANGATATHIFTVTNTGGATTTAMAGAGLAAPFDFFGGAYPGTGGTCGASLAANSELYCCCLFFSCGLGDKP